MVGVEASEERVQQVRDQLGLNDPIPVQYARFAARAILLDFGDSFWQKTSSLRLVLDRLPATFRLAAAAFLLAAPIGIYQVQNGAYVIIETREDPMTAME